MNRSIIAISAFAVAIAMPTLCAAASYTIINLGDLGGGFSEGNAINDSGQVAGDSFTGASGNPIHAFVYDGSMHDLGTLTGFLSGGGVLPEN
jgi:probable HAF family extracellular repeat protein